MGRNDKTVELMDGPDLLRWQSATTLPALGQVMGAWHTHSVASRPGLKPGVGPDPLIDDTDGMRLALVSINRVGLVTIKAQPGAQNFSASGGDWATLCAVQGFVSRPLLDELAPRLEAEFIRYQVLPVRPSWKVLGGGDTIPVAFHNGHPTGWLGRHLTAKAIASEFNVCQPEMIDVLVRAQQITMWHPIAGCNDLWPVLTEWALAHS